MRIKRRREFRISAMLESLRLSKSSRVDNYYEINPSLPGYTGCYPCKKGIRTSSMTTKMHHPLSLMRVSGEDWNTIYDKLAKATSLSVGDVKTVKLKATELYVCSVHSNRIRRVLNTGFEHLLRCGLCHDRMRSEASRPLTLRADAKKGSYFLLEQRLFVNFGRQQNFDNVFGCRICESCYQLLYPDAKRAASALYRDLAQKFGKETRASMGTVLWVCTTLSVSPPNYITMKLPKIPSEIPVSLGLGKDKNFIVYSTQALAICRYLSVDGASIDGRTLRNFISPHLSSVGIQMELDVRAKGHFYVHLRNLATNFSKELSNTKDESYRETLSPEVHQSLLASMCEQFGSKSVRDSISNGTCTLKRAIEIISRSSISIVCVEQSLFYTNYGDTTS